MIKLLAALMLVGVVAGRAYYPISQKERFRQAFLLDCAIQGNTDKVDQVAQAAVDMIECLKGQVDVATLRRRALADPEHYAQTVTSVVQTACNKAPHFDQCFNDSLILMSPCLNTKSRADMNKIKYYIDQLTSYVCANNAQRLTEFINDGGLECIKERKASFDVCLHQEESLESLSHAEFCTKMKPIARCMVRATGECQKPSLVEFVSTVYDYISDFSLCSN